MDTIIQSIWQWLQSQWVQSDLASWLAVGFAVMAVFFALRRSQHVELRLTDLKFDENGGKIGLELDYHTHSHALSFKASAKLKIDGVDYPMKLEEIKAPFNVQFAIFNIFHIPFSGQYVKHAKTPTIAFIDVKVTQSDGSRARLRRKIPLHSGEASSPTND